MKQPKRRRRSIITSCDNPTPLEVYRAALAYRNAGLSLIPIEAEPTKRPAFRLLPQIDSANGERPRKTWKVFQTRLPTVEELHSWFQQSSGVTVYGMAVLGGKVSGNLEILDVDTFDLVEPLRSEIERRCPGLFERLVKVKSPRPGLHLYYRCQTIGGNQKLARIPDPTSDKTKTKTVIEIKGEGGYCLAPPSPRWCHRSERCYLYYGDVDLTEVPTITVQERAALHDAARAFDQWKSLRPKPRPRLRTTPRPYRHGEIRAGDDFNARADWASILMPHGWTFAGDDGGEVDRWRRPGKDESCSATTNIGGSDLLYVFSSNADPFEQNTSYTKFHAYAVLEHDGNFHDAAIALRRLGYGSSRRRSGSGSPKKLPTYSQRLLRSRRRP